MVFPGVNNATSAGYDYDCSTIAFANNRLVQRYVAFVSDVGFSTDYKTSPTATTLNTSSNLVRAVGGGGTGCAQGLQAVGGYGTYYAGVIAAAQAALVAKNPNAFNVIIFLSDGDANASSSNVPSGQATNQCHEGDHGRPGRDERRHGGLYGGLWRAYGQDPFELQHGHGDGQGDFRLHGDAEHGVHAVDLLLRHDRNHLHLDHHRQFHR